MAQNASLVSYALINFWQFMACGTIRGLEWHGAGGGGGGGGGQGAGVDWMYFWTTEIINIPYTLREIAADSAFLRFVSKTQQVTNTQYRLTLSFDDTCTPLL